MAPVSGARRSASLRNESSEAVLHAAGLRRGGPGVDAGVDEQPLEEAVPLERRRRGALALLGEADVVPGHPDEAGGGEVRERLRHARL